MLEQCDSCPYQHQKSEKEKKQVLQLRINSERTKYKHESDKNYQIRLYQRTMTSTRQTCPIRLRRHWMQVQKVQSA